MDEVALELEDLEATRRLGRALARVYGRAGCVLALEGPLGAGKTSLAKAFVAALTGLTEDDVTSPTFVLANEYPGVLHLDAYRLSGAADLATLGYPALETLGRAVLIEWSSRVAGALPGDHLEVELAHAERGRHATVRAHGPLAAQALREMERPMLRLALSGASGRMGKVVQSVAEGFTIVQALARNDALRAGADVVVDFSTAEGLARRAAEAAALGIPLVGCATGLSAKDHAALDEASSRIAVLYAANTSLGVTLLERLVSEVARALEGYDAEIVELHHKHKLDAPSGTALLLAQALATAAGGRQLVHGRQGKSQRKPEELGVHALRLGDVVGEHRVYFAGPGERIELAHVATSRETFARGALRAARWIVGKPAGRYRMSDVLGLSRP